MHQRDLILQLCMPCCQVIELPMHPHASPCIPMHPHASPSHPYACHTAVALSHHSICTHLKLMPIVRRVLIGGLDYVFITVTITQGMLIFGKLAIAMFTAAIAGYWCNTVDDVTSILLPTFLTLLVGYAIALMFCQVHAFPMPLPCLCPCHFLASAHAVPTFHIPTASQEYVQSATPSISQPFAICSPDSVRAWVVVALRDLCPPAACPWQQYL